MKRILDSPAVTSSSLVSLVLIACCSSGCATAYHTPGGRADLAIFVEQDIREVLERKPASPRPVHLAIARVQEPRYSSYTAQGQGNGRFSVVTNREAEQDADLERLGKLPDVAQVVPLNRLLLSDKLESDRELRLAAAALHADMVLIYTFDTHFFRGDVLRPLTVISFGLSPHKDVRVTTTASAILVDVRTGYVYGACEATARQTQLASAWTSSDAVDRSRRNTEREAFEHMLGEFEKVWNNVTPSLHSASAMP